KTGYSALTCRAGLRLLLADGTLMQGASPTARLRVTAAPPDGYPARPAPRVTLSTALAARRHANSLTQPELATLLDVSVTTVGHAETGRLWQAREFWRRADKLLGASGGLLRMYDDLQAGIAGPEPDEPPVPPEPPLPASITITPGGVLVTWPDGTESVARAPGYREWREACFRDEASGKPAGGETNDPRCLTV
ncbi:MAG: helix-turn-helix domain-containing protein, partial [Trebonia sp.]